MTTLPSPPKHYMLALFPCFQLLDVAGPLDILNLLSITSAPNKNISLTIIASTLDPVPTKPIPYIDESNSKPRWTYSGFPTNDNVTNTQFTQSITPTTTFTSYLAAVKAGTIEDDTSSIHKPVDVLLIPGGIGTRIDRVDPDTMDSTSNVADLISFVQHLAPRVRHSIVTVCTGSDVLGQTGILDHRRATTNMARFDMVAERSPAVEWLKARRYVRSLPAEVEGKIDAAGSQRRKDEEDQVCDAHHPFHGEIWTSAGISAGIDVMFAFVAEYHGGIDVARGLAKTLEYEWREIPEGQVDPMYGLSQADVGGSRVVDQS